MTRLARPVGHADVLERLESRARRLRGGSDTGLHHAHLFSGPDGVGKYRAALWWAGLLQCETSGDCGGTCESCRLVAAGVHPDVVVTERAEGGASIGIDAARDLILRLAHKPARRPPRIGIVRDADLMTADAQNSMLKLLEEPPGFSVIVLVAGNASALLPTVRSRCQQTTFGVLEDEEVLAVLASAGRKGEEAQAACAAARGSAGRALSYDPEGLAERTALLLELEAVCGGTGDLEGLVQSLAARKDEGYGLAEILAWQVTKTESALGAASRETDPELRAVLAGLDPSALPQLVHDADQVRRTMGLLARNANAKIAIREMLLNIRA